MTQVMASDALVRDLGYFKMNYTSSFLTVGIYIHVTHFISGSTTAAFTVSNAGLEESYLISRNPKLDF